MFTNGSEKSLRNLVRLLHVYERSSGKKMNFGKSSFYIDDKYSRRASIISRITGMSRGTFPSLYLGVPIIQGRIKIIYFEHLVEKVRMKLEGWKAKLLSSGWRLTLIKVVLASLPIYTTSSTVVPKATLRHIEKLMANFLWNIQGVSRVHWVRWSKICTPIDEGGLGILRMDHLVESLHAKLMWATMSGYTLWAKFARAKYFTEDTPRDSITPSPLWNSLIQQYPRLCRFSKWVVGLGARRFWLDN